MLTRVAREFHWPPEILGGFFIDDIDLNGLEFWYNDVVEVHKELNPKK